MKAVNGNKRQAMGRWLEKTGNGARRKYRYAPQQAREYMKTPPYCGAFSGPVDHKA